MRRIDYIRNASDEELIKFLAEFSMDDIDSEWCNKFCPHIIVSSGKKVDCTGAQAEDCPYAATDHHIELKAWLEQDI